MESYRLINAFRMFCKTIRGTQLSRSVRVLRIRREKQRQYMCYFISTMSDHRLNHQIQRQRQLKKVKQEEKEKLQAERNKKTARIARFIGYRDTIHHLYQHWITATLKKSQHAIAFCK